MSADEKIRELTEMAARMLRFNEDMRLSFPLRYRAAMAYEQAMALIDEVRQHQRSNDPAQREAR